MNYEKRFIEWAKWIRNPPVFSCFPSATREYRLMHDGPVAMMSKSNVFGDGGLVDKVGKLRKVLDLESRVRETQACIGVMMPAMRKLVKITYLEWEAGTIDPVTKKRRGKVKPRKEAAKELKMSEAAYRQKKAEALAVLTGYLCGVAAAAKPAESDQTVTVVPSHVPVLRKPG